MRDHGKKEILLVWIDKKWVNNYSIVFYRWNVPWNISWRFIYVGKCFWSTFPALWIFPSATAELSPSLQPERRKKRISESVIGAKITRIKTQTQRSRKVITLWWRDEGKWKQKLFTHFTGKTKVRLRRDILALFYTKFCLQTHWGLSHSFVPSCTKAGARDRDASPTTMSCFGLWSGLMGCWPALSRSLPLPLYSSSHTLNPTVSLWGGTVGFRVAPDRWSRSRSQGMEGDCISGGECSMERLDGSGSL